MRPIVATLPAAEEELPTLPPAPKVKPAPRIKDTRELSRMSRRQEYSSSTRKALVKSAADLFAERGYAGTSLDEVVSAARVTKGALYHHFAGKLALFQAVFDQCEAGAVNGSPGPTDGGGHRSALPVSVSTPSRMIEMIAEKPLFGVRPSSAIICGVITA